MASGPGWLVDGDGRRRSAVWPFMGFYIAFSKLDPLYTRRSRRTDPPVNRRAGELTPTRRFTRVPFRQKYSVIIFIFPPPATQETHETPAPRERPANFSRLMSQLSHIIQSSLLRHQFSLVPAECKCKSLSRSSAGSSAGSSSAGSSSPPQAGSPSSRAVRRQNKLTNYTTALKTLNTNRSTLSSILRTLSLCLSQGVHFIQFC